MSEVLRRLVYLNVLLRIFWFVPFLRRWLVSSVERATHPLFVAAVPHARLLNAYYALVSLISDDALTDFYNYPSKQRSYLNCPYCFYKRGIEVPLQYVHNTKYRYHYDIEKHIKAVSQPLKVVCPKCGILCEYSDEQGYLGLLIYYFKSEIIKVTPSDIEKHFLITNTSVERDRFKLLQDLGLLELVASYHIRNLDELHKMGQLLDVLARLYTALKTCDKKELLWSLSKTIKWLNKFEIRFLLNITHNRIDWEVKVNAEVP